MHECNLISHDLVPGRSGNQATYVAGHARSDTSGRRGDASGRLLSRYMLDSHKVEGGRGQCGLESVAG